MASFDYNPITGQLDLVGSGGGTSYIDGDVEYHSNLPVTVGTPAVNSAFLVRKGEGLYFISRKPAGIWVRELNNGNLDDWKYAGTFSDLYRDANFRIINDADTSKELAFSLSGLTTGTTRTLTVPDASGTIARTEDFAAPPAIGNTTPSTGAFTTLAANNGTLTASAPVLDLAQTWNNPAPTYKTMVVNVTNAGGSNAATNYPLEIQSAGTAVASISLDGRIRFGGILATGSGTSWSTWVSGSYNNVMSVNAPLIALGSGGTGAGTAGVRLQTEGVEHVLALRNATNPQTFRLYNTFTDASNYERGFMRWSSNVLQIGTEKAGTGSARALEFQVDGTTRLAIASNGGVTVSAGFVGTGNIRASSFSCGTANNGISFGDGFTFITGPSTAGVLTINAFNNTDVLVRLGGTSSSWPALNTSGSTLRIRLADNTGFAPLSCGALTLNGNLDASAQNIVTDTTTGTKIGTGTTQKIGFFNATPVVQQAAIADATDAATTQARLNDLLAVMRTFGLIAT